MISLHPAIGRPVGTVLQAIARMSETRANHRAGLVADASISAILLLAGAVVAEVSPGVAIATILAGLLVFTFVEYCFHRWLFHGTVPLFAPGHRKHHDNPLGHDSLPFFLPPVLVLMLWGVFCLVLPAGVALLLSGGIAAGYAAYGISHGLIHVRRFSHPLARRWAAAHHVHHYHPDRNFGVTTPLWDFVLGTRYRRPAAASRD
jgi:sterol desaturase/sphingolipid hydroxylase (fatty acid hydroxylase superfamily)